ncbi:MAG: hypothetical protein SF066_13170 [Thermoanaerobaculia bacterium]|nr:hypothetical protein [Thermoanaerobaculia bacterium]
MAEIKAKLEREALELTQRAKDQYGEALSVSRGLQPLLQKAGEQIRRAEQAYSRHAYSPFWDRIEEAADLLDEFNSAVEELASLCAGYSSLLGGRRHSFPLFPVDLSTLPNPAPTVRELSRVVNLGLTDFRFANIWEHRRTRQAVERGFRDLGRAANDLRSSLVGSVQDLSGRLADGIQRLVSDGKDRRSLAALHSERQKLILREIRDAVVKD